MNKFVTITRGKCILAGEHAVITGSSLLAKSIEGLNLQLTYTDDSKPINFDSASDCPLSNENLMHFFYSLMDKALKGVGKDLHHTTGTFHLKTNLPACSGLGFSAAICLAVCDWLIWSGWLKAEEKFVYTRHLEDLFHGTSSGADIAASMNDSLILFKPHQGIKSIKPKWWPKIYIKLTDTISSTAEAVKKVQLFRQSHPNLGKEIDVKMQSAVDKILNALQQDQSLGLMLLADAFYQAKECFEIWQLIPPVISQQIQQLELHGAIAVKPTGAGDGGSILSLWAQEPEGEIAKKLIPVI